MDEPLSSPSQSSAASLPDEDLRYYQRTFGNLIKSVMDWYSPIFLEEEVHLLRSVLELEDDSEKLFIRLFLRKHDWIRISALQYAEVKDKEGAIGDLKLRGLIDVGSEYEEDYLNRLTKEEALSLAQHNCVHTQKNVGREELRSKLLANKGSQRKICFGVDGSMRVEKIQEITAKSACGEILRIKKNVAETLNRCVKLFLLEWNQVNSGSNTLGTAILVDLNKRKYPKYEMLRTQAIFSSRELYYEYEEALSYEKEESLLGAELIERWEYSVASLDDEDYFVRRYRPAWVYTRMMASYASTLESMGMYREANEVLQMLLDQDKVMLGARAAWYERLIINFSKHLKDVEQAVSLGLKALEDPLVRSGCLLTIKRKLHRLQTGRVFNEPEYEPPSSVMYATPLPGGLGKKLQYELESGEMGGVEEVVLERWRASGWTGFHSENAVLSFLFVLLFWEELYEMQVPNVFQSPYQAAPLDLFTDAFWVNRREKLIEKLERIGGGDAEGILAKNYVSHYGTMVIGGHWETFTLKDLLRICQGLGAPALAAMMRLIAEDYKHFCTGFPDLILYRSLEGSCDDAEEEQVEVKLIEVKSERDRLSDAQRNWHSIFLANGVPMLVVKVLPEGSVSKKARKQKVEVIDLEDV